jgi:hypothetical protein
VGNFSEEDSLKILDEGDYEFSLSILRGMVLFWIIELKREV